jgi:flavin-dependent dehydrogenase
LVLSGDKVGVSSPFGALGIDTAIKDGMALGKLASLISTKYQQQIINKDIKDSAMEKYSSTVIQSHINWAMESSKTMKRKNDKL